ncbi:MAG: hypothetical protein LBQ32_05090 [Burkholderiaceae bacterium]|jgi:hypothetical protein|nr:hypothetical protein [Burkholderiaceae bacterium]
MTYSSSMTSRTGIAHVVTTTRVHKDKTYRTHLLRRSYREDGKVKNETLGNLSHLPEPLIEIIRRSLRGETFVPLADAFQVIGSLAHGHVHAVALTMQRLGFESLLGSKPSRERDLVRAMWPTAPRSCHRCSVYAKSLVSNRWCWWAIAACSATRASLNCVSSRGWIGLPR